MQARDDRDAAGLELGGDGLVGGHHALNHLVGNVVLAYPDAGHAGLGIQQDLALGHLEVERAGLHAAAAQLLGQRVGVADQRDGLGSRPGTSHRTLFNDLECLPVGQAQARADQRPGKAPTAHAPVLLEGQEGREAEPILPRAQAADAVGELLGQHGDHLVDQIDAVAAFGGLLVYSRTGTQKWLTSAMHAEHAAPCPSRSSEGVVEPAPWPDQRI